MNHPQTRRTFMKRSAQTTMASGALLLPTLSSQKQEVSQNDSINYIGPKKGYTPQIGTLVSMMNWMRDVILGAVRGMNQKGLDYLHDQESNSIGAMLWHLAATERF